MMKYGIYALSLIAVIGSANATPNPINKPSTIVACESSTSVSTKLAYFVSYGFFYTYKNGNTGSAIGNTVLCVDRGQFDTKSGIAEVAAHIETNGIEKRKDAASVKVIITNFIPLSADK